MTKCKHDPDQVYCDKCHHEEMTMTDSLQKIIDTIDCNIKDLTAQGEHDIAGLLFQYKDRLETLQKQPVAYDNGKGYLCSAFHKKKYPAYKECAIPLIRGD